MTLRTYNRITWAVLLLLLCLFLAGAQADEGITTVYSFDSPLQYAISDHGVWINDADTLLWYTNSMYQPEMVAKDSHIVHIASDGDILYYITEEQDLQTLHMIYSYGIVAQEPVQMQEHVRQIEADSDSLLALNEEHEICSVYTGDGSLYPLEIRDWENEQITAFSLWNGILAAYKGESGELSLISIDTNALFFSPVIVPSLDWVQIGSITAEEPWIAAFSGSRLVVINVKDGSKTVVPASLPEDCAGLRRDKTAFYTVGGNWQKLYRIPRNLLRPSRGNTLTIVNSVGDNNWFDATVAMFHKKYPDVEVVERQIDDPRILATEMMSSEGEADLVGIQESNMTISSMFMLHSGALADLNGFEELADAREDWVNLWGMVTTDGRWFGVPETVSEYLWQVNPSIAEKIGWEIPADAWTWDDFQALADRVIAYNETADVPIYLLQEDNFLFPWFFHEYQANHIADAMHGNAIFADESYIRMLEMWKKLNDHHLICSSADMFNKAMRSNTLLFSYRFVLPELRSEFWILPPTESESSRYPVYCAFMALNAHSQHLEEAKYFLQCYLSAKTVSQGFYWNEGQWLSDDSLYDVSQNIYKISQENEDLWNTVLTRSVPEFFLYDIQRQQANTLLPELIAGNITPEQFAEISQQLADMALGE